MKKILRCAFTFTFALIITVLFTATPVHAIILAPDPQEPSKTPWISVQPEQDLTLYPAKDKRNTQAVILTNRKATGLKSSNTDVLTVSQKRDGAFMHIYATLKKAGTATVSCKINGKTYETKITVRKYVCPVSYVKLDSSKLKNTKFKSTSIGVLSNAKFKDKYVKFFIKPAVGWKITGNAPFLDIIYQKNCGDVTLPGFIGNDSPFLANGYKGSRIEVTLQNTKTGQTETIHVLLK